MRVTLALVSLVPVVGWGAGGPVEITLTPAIREYCHIVRFPQGWNIATYDPTIHQPLFYGYDSLYEFRVPGELETTFLVAGIILPSKKYTINKYRVNLSDPAAIAHPATEKEWLDGTKIPTTREEVVHVPHLTNEQPINFNGFQFTKTGNIWAGENSRVSPDRVWIVLLSSSGTVAKRDEFLIFGGRDKGKLFFDVFNADSGRKLMTIVGAYVDIDPGHALNQSIWVTERYFIVPLGEHRERCLVCDLHPHKY
jgi:hypothetical protein